MQIRKTVIAILSLVALYGIAIAQEHPLPGLESLPPAVRSQVVVVQGLICDTPDQVKEYLTIRDSGVQPHEALEAVNTHARAGDKTSDDGCGLGVWAVVPGEEGEVVKTKDETYRLTRVLFVGFVIPGDNKFVLLDHPQPQWVGKRIIGPVEQSL